MNNPNFNTILAEALAKCKPLTNYERLVSKTPQEMAYFLSEIRYSLTCVLSTEEGCPNPETPCSKCWLDWLKSPVEVDNGT